MKIDKVSIIRINTPTLQNKSAISITALAEVSYYVGQDRPRRTETFRSVGSVPFDPLEDRTKVIKEQLAELKQHLKAFDIEPDENVEVTP